MSLVNKIQKQLAKRRILSVNYREVMWRIHNYVFKNKLYLMIGVIETAAEKA